MHVHLRYQEAENMDEKIAQGDIVTVFVYLYTCARSFCFSASTALRCPERAIITCGVETSNNKVILKSSLSKCLNNMI